MDTKAGEGDEEEEEYYEYYDEEEDADGEESKEIPDLMVVGTGIASAELNAVDPAAAAIEREKEELKVPEEERKAIEQMSDIEKSIVAKSDKAAAALKA